MVSPVGFGRSIPLQQAVGAAGAGGAAPAPAPAAPAAPVAPAAPQPATVHDALRFVADLWVPIKATDTEGRRTLRGQDERLQHWYYPKLGAAIAAEYVNPRTPALRKVSSAQTSSQLLIAITNFNRGSSAPITGNDIKRVAAEKDPEFLKESIKICLGNIVNSVNYRQAVDADYYEGALYKMLTSGYRSGASRAAVIPHVMTALKSVREGKDITATAAILANAELEDAAGNKYKAFKISAVIPAGGVSAAPSGALAGYPPKAIELAKELVKLKAQQDGEALAESQINERAAKLLTTVYKDYLEYPSTMVKKLEDAVADERSKTGDTKYFTLKSEGLYTFGSDKSFGFAKSILGLEFSKLLPITSTTYFGLSSELVASTGVEKETPGLSTDMAYVGGLRTNKSAAPLVGTVTADLNYESNHSASVKAGLIEGTWGSKATYKTPSLFANTDEDFRIHLEGSVTTEKMDNPVWSKGGKVTLDYHQSKTKKTPSVFDKANVSIEVLSEPESTTSQLMLESGLKFADGKTLSAKYTRVVLGDVNQALALKFGTSLSAAVDLKVEGSYVNKEKQTAYGMSNSGISLDGTEVISPAALNASSLYRGAFKFIFNMSGGLKPSIGAGAAYVNSSVEDLSDSRMRWFVMGGLDY